MGISIGYSEAVTDFDEDDAGLQLRRAGGNAHWTQNVRPASIRISGVYEER